MGFLKKCMFGGAALIFILLGGAGTQSSSMLLQGGGFLGLIFGLVVLFFFAKMAWRAMGCLPSLLIVIAVIFFILYAIGAFSNGIEGLGENIRTFLGQGVQTSEEIVANAEAEKKEAKEDGVVNLIGPDKHPLLAENIKDKILPKKKEKKKNAFNPMQYPAIEGMVRVLSGDILSMGGRNIKLFGIAAPDISQTCADASGRGYKCGHQALSWLSGWLAENVVKCHILKEDERGVFLGVCLLGPYDIGAALVNAGWAVADDRQTKIYFPYQEQAIANKRGLWQGTFYMPWDWKKIQGRRANIKIIKKKNNSSRRRVWFNPFGD